MVQFDVFFVAAHLCMCFFVCAFVVAHFVVHSVIYSCCGTFGGAFFGGAFLVTQFVSMCYLAAHFFCSIIVFFVSFKNVLFDLGGKW